jgi:hypothetical protein
VPTDRASPDHKVSLGFVEGLNNKIRVLQRRAYGLRDEQYLRLKILTCHASGALKTAKTFHTFAEDPFFGEASSSLGAGCEEHP